MKLFESAKIKLTLWYLAIIMSVTLSFSSFVYIGVMRSTHDALEIQKRKIVRQFLEASEYSMPPKFVVFDIETLVEIRHKTLLVLLVVNGAVLVISGALAYFLAEKTLMPIEKTVEKQKRFISDAAHEIKTPLAAMKIDLEVSLRDKNLKLDECKDLLKSTIVEIDSLNLLTKRLLEKSRYQQVEDSMDFQKVNIKEVLENVSEKFRNSASEKSIALNLNLEQLMVKADKEMLKNVFENLLDNAIKYTNQDGEIKILVQKDHQKAKIEFIDNGIGIDSKNLDRIFDPFYRVDESRNKIKNEGHGLGLSIVKDIIDKHKGEISVISAKGKGSTFTITLPLLS